MSANLKKRVVNDWGDGLARVGSEPWAKRWFLDLTNAIDHLHLAPKVVDVLKRQGADCRAWTLLSNADGEKFKTWEEFCRAERPYGLGKDPKEIETALTLAMGKKEIDLLTVAPAQSPPGKTIEVNPHEEGNLRNGHATTERLRAIAERAPEPVRDLYRQDLIGVKEAAALGPKNPTPEQAAEVTRVAQEAREVAKATQSKEEVNKHVRRALGRQDDPVEAAVRKAKGVPPERWAEFMDRLRVVAPI